MHQSDYCPSLTKCGSSFHLLLTFAYLPFYFLDFLYLLLGFPFLMPSSLTYCSISAMSDVYYGLDLSYCTCEYVFRASVRSHRK